MIQDHRPSAAVMVLRGLVLHILREKRKPLTSGELWRSLTSSRRRGPDAKSTFDEALQSLLSDGSVLTTNYAEDGSYAKTRYALSD